MFTYAAVLLLVTHAELRLVVHTEVGSIQGVPAGDGDYVMFLGIPYAKVNTSNPFGASIAQEKFDKVFEAFTESAVCPQNAEVYFIDEEAKIADPYDGNLDCLRLSVYVPNSETKHKAVYVFMHGGRLVRGDGGMRLYGPKYLVRHDVIVITFNYRLGPYGFMCLDIPEIPGNQGLWDQYKAVKWVRDNIRAFGGDPQKITIGGHSAGAMVVGMHLLTKQPRMFQQAIMQSGSATSPGFIKPPDPMALIKIANKFGFKTNDTYAALTFLAKASPEAVIKATDDDYEWSVCVEKEFEGVDSFVVENPELSKGTNIDGLNILSGFVAREGVYSLYDASNVQQKQQDVLSSDMGYKFNLQNYSNLVEIVRHFYVGDDNNSESNKYKNIEFLADFNFVYPIQREMQKYTKHQATNVYMYLFSYDGHLNRFKRLYNVTEAGATHSDELGYIFKIELIPDIPNTNDQRKIDEMTTLWTNFIKYGNPTPVSTALLPVTWPPLTAATVPCLQIDANLTVISRPFHKSMAFWDLFYDAHLDKLSIAPEKKISANNLFRKFKIKY